MLVGLAGMLVPRAAVAYPQWQFSSGTSRCNQCHFAPAGGGLINGYGRDASADDLSTWKGSGDFAHGKVELPSSLALGFDGRLAATSHDAGNSSGARHAVFPMQADVYARMAFSAEWSASVTGGFRGQSRADTTGQGDDNYAPIGASRAISREHYLMWRPGATGPYARAGRFFAPYGLRLAEHTSYVRRDLGFNLLEESYGVSGGMVEGDHEFHVTVFGPDFVRQQGARDAGVAAMYEQRLGDVSAVGLDTRLGFGKETTRMAGGFFAKTFVEKAKLMLMAQGDFVHSTFKFAPTATTNGSVGYLGATYFPCKGAWLTLFVEERQTSLAVKDTLTTAYGAQANWFPFPHWELVLMGRAQAPAQTTSPTNTVLFFVHYYL